MVTIDARARKVMKVMALFLAKGRPRAMPGSFGREHDRTCFGTILTARCGRSSPYETARWRCATDAVEELREKPALFIPRIERRPTTRCARCSFASKPTWLPRRRTNYGGQIAGLVHHGREPSKSRISFRWRESKSETSTIATIRPVQSQLCEERVSRVSARMPVRTSWVMLFGHRARRRRGRHRRRVCSKQSTVRSNFPCRGVDHTSRRGVDLTAETQPRGGANPRSVTRASSQA